MENVRMEEAQRRLPELTEAAASGEEVVISRGDGARFRLVPVVEAPPRRAGGARGRIVVPDDFDEPLPDFALYT